MIQKNKMFQARIFLTNFFYFIHQFIKLIHTPKKQQKIINSFDIKIEQFSWQKMQKVLKKMYLNPQNELKKDPKTKQQNYIKKQFTRFLQTYQINGQRKYVKLAKKSIQSGQYNLLVTLNDFLHFNRDAALTVYTNYYRYQSIFNRTLTEFMKNVEKQIQEEQMQDQTDQNHHTKNLKPEYNKNQIKQQQNNQEKISYQVSFDQGFTFSQDSSIRNLKCQNLGHLRTIVGTVTRVSQVRPELVEGVFTCMNCGRNSERIIQQFKYTKPKKCMKQNCGNNSNWELNNKLSYFADFQKVRLQQDSSKIPPGSMPRSIQVVLRNQNTQKGQPGDQIEVVGFLNVIPDISSLLRPGQRTMLSTKNLNTRRQNEEQGISGIKGMRQLTYKLCFVGNYVKILNNQFNENILVGQEEEQADQYDQELILSKLTNNFTNLQKQSIMKIRQDPRIYENLSQSLFHEIYGHSEIKKALLLQLLGGVHKTTETKISIRGDINILIVGDPSTAKSQFLKCINKFVPRSVYTNGKTTTAAGLTASIVRDEDTGNVSIEAGALLLADNGICCIDQFDKMQIKDQVAIHEAMEQQTISLAKAGIQATLHARTSILAAANPIFGRYNKSQSLKKNINISPPIMSRFDLYFIICDQVNEQADHNLSSFIVDMHINPQKSKLRTLNAPYTLQQIRNYLTVAKKIKPRLTHSAAQFLRKHYVDLRKSSKQKGAIEYQVTVRQLQSMIRLSQAMAKMYLDMQIRKQYVQQAFRLLDCSIVKLQKSVYELIDDQHISDNQKITMGLYSAVNQTDYQISHRKNKKVTIQQDVFNNIQKNIMQLFREKRRRHNLFEIKEVEEYLSQQDVIAYLMATDLNTGNLSNSVQNQYVRRLYNKIVNKLIKQEILIVIQDSKQLHEKKLTIHPNYFIEHQNQHKKQQTMNMQ